MNRAPEAITAYYKSLITRANARGDIELGAKLVYRGSRELRREVGAILKRDARTHIGSICRGY